MLNPLQRLLLIVACQSLATGLVFAQAPVSGEGSQGGSIEQRLDRVERILQGQGLMDMLEELQQLQQEMRILRGDIESQNYALEQLTRRQRDLYTDIDQRLQRLEQGGTTAEPIPSFGAGNTTSSSDDPPLETLGRLPGNDNSRANTPSSSALQVEIVRSPEDADNETAATAMESMDDGMQTGTEGMSEGMTTSPDAEGTDTVSGTSAVTSTASQTPTDNPPQQGPTDPAQLQAEYQQAFNLLRQGLYDQAISAFQQFLALHPDDRYSDNAQYWLAEAYYVKREFQQALGEYNNVITRFPQSQKINDAMLKIGFTLYELGEMDSARRQLQELIQKQPGSTVARLADERLKMISAAAQDNQTVPDTSTQ